MTTRINGARPFCPRGHQMTKANTYTNPRGTRECRKCMQTARIRRVIRERETGHVYERLRLDTWPAWMMLARPFSRRPRRVMFR